MKIYYSISLAFLLASACSFSQSKQLKGTAIVSYNVENLYDTINDPNTKDDDFLPQGKQKWNGERYRIKLDKLAEAITLNLACNPVLIGLVEIENKQVVSDLKNTGKLASTNYQISQKDSPDKRGIDCALLYNADRFKLISEEALTVAIDSIPDFYTRDILYVNGLLDGKKMIHVFVNHWPSRRGGEKESEFKRIHASAVAQKKIQEILAKDPQANILLMGDFNDYPDNASIQAFGKFGFTDLLADEHAAKKGTFNYKGDWGALDHFIVSNSLLKGKNGIKLQTKGSQIVYDEKLIYTGKDGSKKPNSTYGGPNYYGGYSDHLPIRVFLK